MGGPSRARTWTLRTLDRDRVYLLRWNSSARRWDIALPDSPETALTTRAPTDARARRTARKARSAEDRSAGPSTAGTTT